MKLRKRPYAVRNMEQLEAYIVQGGGKIPGEFREHADYGSFECEESLRGEYTHEEDGSVTFAIRKHQTTGSIPITDGTFSCNAIGVVIMSRHEIPVTDLAQA